MLDGTYVTKVDSPLGKKDGKVTLTTHGSAVKADIDAPVVGKQHLTGVAQGDTFTAHGNLRIPFMGAVDYDVEGKVVGDVLRLCIHSSKGDLTLEGPRI